MTEISSELVVTKEVLKLIKTSDSMSFMSSTACFKRGGIRTWVDLERSDHSLEGQLWLDDHQGAAIKALIRQDDSIHFMRVDKDMSCVFSQERGLELDSLFLFIKRGGVTKYKVLITCYARPV